MSAESYSPVTILDAPLTAVMIGMSGEVEWKWILSDRGVMLGFFPQGDAYEAAWNGIHNQEAGRQEGELLNSREGDL